MKRLLLSFFLAVCAGALAMSAKTLVVYYSYTNNVETIVNELKSQIECDIVEIEPAEKGLNYAANNYAIGSSLISAIRNNPDDAASYPEIDVADVDLDIYDTIIIGAPLWWSQMAAPLQTYLFQNGSKMAGKKIGLIVSSHSSGISGVVEDAKRLIPHGEFVEPSLWIRSSETSNCKSIISKWLDEIHYQDIASAVALPEELNGTVKIFNVGGTLIAEKSISEISDMPNGIYILKDRNLKARKVLVKH